MNGESMNGSHVRRLHRPRVKQRDGFDYLIVGAGFAGSVLAERLAADAGKRVLIVDRRPHIGGNAYDYYNDAGVLVHLYGPHIFHTNAQQIADYLSRFTSWRPYEHRVLAHTDGLLVPIPINRTTTNRLYNPDLSSDEVEAFMARGPSLWMWCVLRRTWLSARSAASFTSVFSAVIPASNGVSTLPNWTGQ